MATAPSLLGNHQIQHHDGEKANPRHCYHQQSGRKQSSGLVWRRSRSSRASFGHSALGLRALSGWSCCFVSLHPWTELCWCDCQRRDAIPSVRSAFSLHASPHHPPLLCILLVASTSFTERIVRASITRRAHLATHITKVNISQG